MLKKIIVLPDDLDLSEGSANWVFMRTDAFSKLRNTCQETLTDIELLYLREHFEEWTMLTDEDKVLHYVYENEPLSVNMMAAASFELTSRMLSRQSTDR